jgi:GlpG protein
MRLIGHLADEAAARLFGDYLYVQGIANQLEHEKPDGWGVWVNEEDHVERAAALLEGFRKNPTDPVYRRQGKGAEELREQEQKDQEAYRKRLKNRRHLFRPLTPYGFGPLTFAMIAMSLAVFAWTGFGESFDPVKSWFITDFGPGMVFDKSLPEIRHGELWRLVTPIFLHFGAMHIIFNLLWLRDLGSMVEGRQSTVHLLLLVLVIACCSNIAQWFYDKNPNFGGMSGIVYGLIGYIWIRGKVDPGSGLYLHSYTVISALVWFGACFVPHLFSFHVANGAHAAGLGVGMLWGFLSSLKYR